MWYGLLVLFALFVVVHTFWGSETDESSYRSTSAPPSDSAARFDEEEQGADEQYIAYLQATSAAEHTGNLG